MLRPATPLTIILFISFVFLLISVLSTPIIKGIPLAKYGDVSFGVFGYCHGTTDCSGIRVGYSIDSLFGGESITTTNINIPPSLLIVHPIAAFFNLVLLALAAAAHFHSPSHSARYLLALLVLVLPTLLLTLLAFLVDVLLFIPHLSWAGWIVLASVILVTSSGIILCGMRRTLVSRKARKKRIQENAEMSGENFYNRQNQESKYATVQTFSAGSTKPMVSGTPGADNLPSFATHSGSGPNNHMRSIDMSQPETSDVLPVSPTNEENRFYSNRSRSNSRPRTNPSEPVSPVLPGPEYGPGPEQHRQQPPLEQYRQGPPPPSVYANRARGYGPPRGRGAPRGGFPPRGGYRGPPPPQSYPVRGGFAGRGRGGYPPGPPMGSRGGAIMMAGIPGMRSAPPDYRSPVDGPQISQYGPPRGITSAPPDQMPSQYPHHDDIGYEPMSPSDYGSQEEQQQQQQQQQPRYVAYGGHVPSNGKHRASPYHTPRQSEDGGPRPPSLLPDVPLIGQAVEMDATTGRASGSGYGSDTGGLTGAHRNAEMGGAAYPMHHTDEYVAPRAEWGHQDTVRGPGSSHSVEHPMRPQHRARGSSVTSRESSRYYEDVDPRFAEADPMPPVASQIHHPNHASPVAYRPENTGPDAMASSIPHVDSYENIPVGARSPAESDQSHFTSVSQRPVNPNWKPAHGDAFNSFGPARKTNQQYQVRQDMLLANNPDFELPGMGGARAPARGGRGSMRGGMTMGGPIPRRPLPPSALGTGNDGRYPDPAVPNGAPPARDI